MIAQTVLYFAQSLQSTCSVYVDIPRIILLVSFLYHTKVNMVFIELYKPRVTRMKYIEGKIRNFLNRKRQSYFILQEIPDLFSYHKYSNMQLYIRRCFIICICKILVQNFIIKDILKKKNDVRRISVRTIVNVQSI